MQYYNDWYLYLLYVMKIFMVLNWFVALQNDTSVSGDVIVCWFIATAKKKMEIFAHNSQQRSIAIDLCCLKWEYMWLFECNLNVVLQIQVRFFEARSN